MLNNPETFVNKGISAVTGIKLPPLSASHAEHPEIRFSPNPSDGWFVVQGILSSFEIQMYSSLGEEVFSEALSVEQRLISGLYRKEFIG